VVSTTVSSVVFAGPQETNPRARTRKMEREKVIFFIGWALIRIQYTDFEVN
jgi:hypothetical protein